MGEDIEQQGADVGDAVAVFPEVSVSFCRIKALQQPQGDWKQHFHEVQRGSRHALRSQRLLDAQKRPSGQKRTGRLKGPHRQRKSLLCINNIQISGHLLRKTQQWIKVKASDKLEGVSDAYAYAEFVL